MTAEPNINHESEKLLSHVWCFVTPWTVAHQAPLSMEFSRQDYWSRLPFPSPWLPPDPGIEPGSPALQADSLIRMCQMFWWYTLEQGLCHLQGPHCNACYLLYHKYSCFSRPERGPWAQHPQAHNDSFLEEIRLLFLALFPLSSWGEQLLFLSKKICVFSCFLSNLKKISQGIIQKWALPFPVSLSTLKIADWWAEMKGRLGLRGACTLKNVRFIVCKHSEASF